MTDFGTIEIVLPQGIYLEYESFITYHLKAMDNVRVCVHKQRLRQTDDKQTGQKVYAPDLLMPGLKKITYFVSNMINS